MVLKVRFFLGAVLTHTSLAYANANSFSLDEDSIPTIAPVAALDTSALQKDADLFLSVFVNQYPSRDLIRIKTDGQGQFSISGTDLRALRLKIDASVSDTQWVSLKELPWLNYTYDLANQTLSLNVPLTYLTRYAVELGTPKADTSQLDSQSFNANIFNYNFYQNYSRDKKYSSLNGQLMINQSWGSLSHQFLYNNEEKTTQFNEKFVRLSTTWRYVDPIQIRSYTLGDFVSNSAQWNTSVRLLGLQWASAYEQRSDLVTTASPEFSGSATLPSTLDLYVNQQKIYSGSIPSGPFDVKTLPFISGNQVTLVTTDINGQQVVSTKPYYTSVKILQKGIKQFSVDLGTPRFNYALRSNDYASQLLFSSSSIRYGLTPQITVDGGVEASSNGLLNLGMGATRNVFDRGILSVDLAASQYRGKQGTLASTALELNVSSKLNMNFSLLNSFDGYFNLARVSDHYYATHYANTNELSSIDTTSSAKQVFRLGANYQFTPSTGMYAGYNSVVTPNSRYKQATLNLATSINQRWGVFFSAYQDLINRKSYGAYLTLRYTPKSSPLNVSTMAGLDNGNVSKQLDIASASTQSLGSLGWGVTASQNQATQGGSGYLNYVDRYAYLSARYSHSNDLKQLGLSASGSLVFAENRFFATNQVGDGYALVTNAGPKTKIINGGVSLGETDAKGRFFIPDLTPYRTHTIYANPQDLPLDWRIDSTEKKLATGYKKGAHIDFGARKVISAIVHLVNSSHVDLGAGYIVTINGKEQSVLGYGGEVFVDGLLEHNTVVVDLLDHGQCKAQFDYHGKASGIEKIGPFVCQ
ncbi:fimbria/pilus outer membrane usher protein [Acinetobacter boissieri]|uniref:Outer membrane usher protein FimD/PapC n=1 Tax=Acinetobacter boissieri TaxID=1219383 RepID=A0A1G6H9M1_9GAMM|nr:fimbria/pilus outer membrane usher protein [Acinetobacter boissieri]SDB90987.1 Outer membrane usher protein FimD/PapC [Acinetobacter boissieri]